MSNYRTDITQPLRSRGLLSVFVLTVLLLVAACEGDTATEDDGTLTDTTTMTEPGMQMGTTTDTVEVTLTEYTIEMPRMVRAGTMVFDITNEGTMEHSFEVEGQGMEESLNGPLEPDESATLEVDLQAGMYTVYCPVDDHAEEEGMELELTVEQTDMQPGGTTAPQPGQNQQGENQLEMEQNDSEL